MLTEMAQEMRRLAVNGPQKRMLHRGLALSVSVAGGHWRLSAGRRGVFPSAKEGLIVARAFGVPIGTEPVWTERDDGWFVMTWRWIEVEVPRQGGLIPEQTSYE